MCLTAYTYPIAALISPYVDMILVGDSVGMVLYGDDSTQKVELEMMIRHGASVKKAAPDTCVIIDMPFGSYESSKEEALTNASKVLQDTGADAVKLEGGADMAPTIAHLVENNIPVMAHIGLLPQSVSSPEGFTVRGKTEEEYQHILADAAAVEQAGAFAVVIECVKEALAIEISNQATIPTIGIGASAACDGQVLVTEDVLGLSQGKKPKFVPTTYANMALNVKDTISEFTQDVRKAAFPSAEYCYK